MSDEPSVTAPLTSAEHAELRSILTRALAGERLRTGDDEWLLFEWDALLARVETLEAEKAAASAILDGEHDCNVAGAK